MGIRLHDLAGSRRRYGYRWLTVLLRREGWEVNLNNLATFAEFEADLIGSRTREGMKIARAKGRRRGKQPKLSDKQQKELGGRHGTGQCTISDLAEFFSISHPTVYRTLLRSAQS